MLYGAWTRGLIILTLKTWYEAVSEKILPSLRALVAEILIKQYKYTQIKAAEALGVTQPAISHYLTGKRGSLGVKILRQDPVIMKGVERIAYCITRNDLGCVNDVLDQLIDYIRRNDKILNILLDKEYRDLLNILRRKI